MACLQASTTPHVAPGESLKASADTLALVSAVLKSSSICSSVAQLLCLTLFRPLDLPPGLVFSVFFLDIF